MMFPILCTDLPALLSGALQFGYGVVTHGLFKKVCSSWLTPLREHLASVAPNVEWSRDFEEWFGGLKAISPQVWPLKRAGCIRETREAIILDLVGASAALLGLTEVERSDSEIGNIRAETFEVQIQEMIDETKWKPNPEVAALRAVSYTHLDVYKRQCLVPSVYSATFFSKRDISIVICAGLWRS